MVAKIQQLTIKDLCLERIVLKRNLSRLTANNYVFAIRAPTVTTILLTLGFRLNQGSI